MGTINLVDVFKAGKFMKKVSKKKKDSIYKRELSRMDFNFRVLMQSVRMDIPFLERLKFLAISSSNLDEFFMLRLKAIKKANDNKIPQKLKDKFAEYSIKQHMSYMNIIDGLNNQGVKFVKYSELNDKEKAIADSYFKEKVEARLEIYLADSINNLKCIENLQLNLAVLLQGDDRKIGIIEIPKNMNRYLKLSTGNNTSFLLLEELIKNKINEVFEDYHILASGIFRLIKNANVCNKLKNSQGDYLCTAKKIIKKRKTSAILRLELPVNTDTRIKNILKKQLEISEESIFELPFPLDLSFLNKVYKDINMQQLKYSPIAENSSKLTAIEIYSKLKKEDIFFCHPFDSFNPILTLLENAANDDAVIEIKQTLYRIAEDSKVISALAQAAKKGKKVKVFVELKASLDEEQNIKAVSFLEESGCEVYCGMNKLKVHCKLLMITRKEKEGETSYLHIATANYNETTATQYTDCALLSSKIKLCKEANEIFDFIFDTKKISELELSEILLSPYNLRKELLKLIDAEISKAKKGKAAQIIIKANSLSDKEIIKKLIKAADAGVKINLIIRGICCIKARKNLRIVSIVGRFLEHSRIMYFSSDGKEKLLIGSSDLRASNLDDRVETLVYVEEEKLKQKLKQMLNIILKDNFNSYEKMEDSYKMPQYDIDDKFDSHEELYRLFKEKQ